MRAAGPKDDLGERTKAFALRVIKVVDALPAGRASDVAGRQLVRSGTSIGANYREARRSATKKHFASTLQICLREADETAYWLELIAESKLIPEKKLADLRDECDQLIAILVASIKTARSKSQS